MNRACAIALLLVAAPAWADKNEPKPDPAVAHASEANLESTALRKGFVFTVALGPCVTLGFGVDDATGTGGGGVIRLAHVATPRSLVTLEIVGAALLHQVEAGADTMTYTNQVTNFMLGTQLYANPALWFRLAAGFGRYLGENVLIEGEPGQPSMRGNLRLAGPAFSGGAGIDAIRLKRIRLGLEIVGTGMINREGVLASGGFLLSFTVD